MPVLYVPMGHVEQVDAPAALDMPKAHEVQSLPASCFVESVAASARYLPAWQVKQVVDKELQIIDPNSKEGRIPLMKPPEGEDIAWERSGHQHHA